MTPNQERLVRERAYLLWEDEGRPEGCAERHWSTAEEALADEAEAWETPGSVTLEPRSVSPNGSDAAKAGRDGSNSDAPESGEAPFHRRA